jgi:hypothetical protein
MDMERGLQQTIDRLLARQTEEMKAGQLEVKVDINYQAEANQDKEDAEATAFQDKFTEDMKDYMEALLEGLRSCGNWTTICPVASVVCSDNSKAVLKEMEAAMKSFEK